MKILLWQFLILIPVLASGQTFFEGTIIYKYEVHVKNKQINEELLRHNVGKGSTLSFKEGNFRHDYDQGMIEFQIYRRDQNREYVKMRGSDTIQWSDCRKGGSKIKSLVVTRKSREVLRMMCDQLKIEYTNHVTFEYYNADSIRIDPQWFANFQRGQQNKIDAIEKSIFLRQENHYPAATIISNAVAIQEKSIRKSMFELPDDAILVQVE